MSESGIGRVLVASVHQAIGEVLPTRLAFYENFLAVDALREGTIGLAPLSAVLSFLRQEGEAYDAIMARAGVCSAEWTVESMPPLERSTIASAPGWLRARLVVRVARQLVRRSYEQSRASSRIRRGTIRVEVTASVFCTVREPVPAALCGYYAAAFSRLLALFGLPTTSAVAACRGKGDKSCVLTFSPTALVEDLINQEPAA